MYDEDATSAFVDVDFGFVKVFVLYSLQTCIIKRVIWYISSLLINSSCCSYFNNFYYICRSFGVILFIKLQLIYWFENMAIIV